MNENLKRHIAGSMISAHANKLKSVIPDVRMQSLADSITNLSASVINESSKSLEMGSGYSQITDSLAINTFNTYDSLKSTLESTRNGGNPIVEDIAEVLYHIGNIFANPKVINLLVNNNAIPADIAATIGPKILKVADPNNAEIPLSVFGVYVAAYMDVTSTLIKALGGNNAVAFDSNRLVKDLMTRLYQNDTKEAVETAQLNVLIDNGVIDKNIADNYRQNINTSIVPMMDAFGNILNAPTMSTTTTFTGYNAVNGFNNNNNAFVQNQPASISGTMTYGTQVGGQVSPAIGSWNTLAGQGIATTNTTAVNTNGAVDNYYTNMLQNAPQQPVQSYNTSWNQPVIQQSYNPSFQQQPVTQQGGLTFSNFQQQQPLNNGNASAFDYQSTNNFQQPINNGWNQQPVVQQPIWTLTKQVRDNQNNLVDVYQNQFNGVMMVPSPNNNNYMSNNYLQNPLYNNGNNTYNNAGITYMGGAV